MTAVRRRAVEEALRAANAEYVDVDIDIDIEDLVAAGWVYIGKGAEGDPPTETVLDTVKTWHAEAHPHHWRFCQEEPCHTLNREGPLS